MVQEKSQKKRKFGCIFAASQGIITMKRGTERQSAKIIKGAAKWTVNESPGWWRKIRKK